MSANHRLLRPTRAEIIVMSKFLEDDSYLTMTVTDLVGKCMANSGGQLHPGRLKALWLDLKEEAGVK